MSLFVMIVFWDVVGASTSDRVGGDVSAIICVPVVSVVCVLCCFCGCVHVLFVIVMC